MNFPGIEDQTDELIQHYSKVLENEDDERKYEERQAIRSRLKSNLMIITTNLNKLLIQNKEAEELE